ncbi:SMC family ATPase [Brachybacterium halotolerans subsp. kimchii]|uniref:AAA family ATPase n=1 Tax=Brachybacterium halotolerans TaxID=2795215 RepID=UPI001E59E502|nr:SMC family ATPase [Brachybacterium halotolerans]UEJ84253.1 SMC family ATPase [Brachybacterium halotolerans subsp. kimchii]
MKLHHLHLRGIGPFAGAVDIDFAALGASGMFLLEGPTGSGKSTILDAIVYALYGSVAGSGASSDRIRSQFAASDSPSAVDLVFETSAGIFRVHREPDYERAKKRGTGTTKQQAKALLWRLGSPELLPGVIAEIAGGAADGADFAARTAGTGSAAGTAGAASSPAGAAEPLATRLDEVGREIQRAVGLSREQFTQTVLLPQNEFARFLRAGTGERQQVLQRVFGTEIYQDVEKQLEEMRKEAKREVDAAKGSLGRSLARFVEAVGVEGEPLDALEGHAEALRLEELGAAAREHLAASRQAAADAAQDQDAQAASEASARAHAEQTALARTRIDRRRELDALGARLDAAAPQIRSARARLARDEAARPVAELLRRRDQAASTASRAEKDLADLAETTRAQHPEIADLLAGEDAPAALAASAEEDTARAGALADLASLEEGLENRGAQLAARAERSDQAARDLAALDETIEARPASKQELLATRDDARTRAAGLADARLAEKTAAERLQAARAAAQQQTALTQAETLAASTLEAARLASETESDLRRRRFAGIAAELAVDLGDDAPCPVCGSADHPHPATPTHDAVGAEQVEQAEAQRQQAERAYHDAAQKKAVIEGELEALRERAGGLDARAAEAAHTAAREAAAQATAAQTEAAEAETAISAHDEATAKLTAERSRQALALERERTAQQEASAALEKDRARVADARGEAESIAVRRSHHAARARAATALREALRASTEEAARAASLSQETETARETARAALREQAEPAASEPTGSEAASGSAASEPAASAPTAQEGADDEALADDAAVREAVLPEAERRTLTASLQQRAVEESRHADGLAEDGVSDADPSDEALEAARVAASTAGEQLVAAQSALREASAVAARLGAVAERSASALEALERAMHEVTGVSERAGVVVRVADLATARSADGRRIPLSTFVLMRRFEDVVDAANARLARFSGTDLELLRDDGARGARKTGLDLLVMDRRTDQARVPETLSGGETFFVSLALALGLADIVTGEAGGVRMETLFIDEGFGSLDPQTLETVVAEIGHLSQHGRTIGIVSHVGDLKTQIAEQIHVRRGPSGSSTATITA